MVAAFQAGALSAAETLTRPTALRDPESDKLSTRACPRRVTSSLGVHVGCAQHLEECGARHPKASPHPHHREPLPTVRMEPSCSLLIRGAARDIEYPSRIIDAKEGWEVHRRYLFVGDS